MPGAGVGLKAEHLEPALAATASGLWFEVHAENHLVDGGPRLDWLEAVRARHPVSLHGVSASLAGTDPPDPAHVARFAALVRRIEPCLVSEHLAWSSRGGRYLPDLLPFPRTAAALRRVASNVSRLQDALGRRVAIENPSHYLTFPAAAHDRDEIDFLGELVRRTGCGLLLDLNNVHVSAHNLGFEPRAWLDRFPLGAVMELHLAGHSLDPALGSDLLVDSHDAPVAEDVWALLDHVLARTGPLPTLIERDGNLPPWGVLEAERQRADAALHAASHAVHGSIRPRADRLPRADAADCPESAMDGFTPRATGTVRATIPVGSGAAVLPSDAAFQCGFAAALATPSADDGSPMSPDLTADPLAAALARQPAFAVYRNTVVKGAIDALEANHPAIVRLVGRDWFRSAASRYVAESPPRDARLVHYGDGFDTYLASLESTAELPYLAGVAAIERAWTEAHVAAAAAPLEGSALSALEPAELEGVRLVLHPDGALDRGRGASGLHDLVAQPGARLHRGGAGPRRASRHRLARRRRTPDEARFRRPGDGAPPRPDGFSGGLSRRRNTRRGSRRGARRRTRDRPCRRDPRASRRGGFPGTRGTSHGLPRRTPADPMTDTITTPSRLGADEAGFGTLAGVWRERFTRAVPQSLLALAARVGIAAVFWQSARTKVEGVLTVSDNAIELFRSEYRLPVLPPELAAHLAAYAEHLFPFLLVLGLATRLSALALLGMTAVIQIFVYPSAWPTHLTWAALLLLLIGRGPGHWSLDHWLFRDRPGEPRTRPF